MNYLEMSAAAAGWWGANDVLNGSTGADTFDGKGGNDVEVGNTGADAALQRHCLELGALR